MVPYVHIVPVVDEGAPMVMGSFDRREFYNLYLFQCRQLVALLWSHLMSLASWLFAGVSGLNLVWLYVSVYDILR